jgi:hypothetical protein
MAKTKNKKYIAKIKTMNGQYGVHQSIESSNVNPENDDGSPNKYHTGVLIFFDAETGNKYLVKQLKIEIPKDGMHPNLAKNGYTANVVIDLDNEYHVEKLD